MNLKTFKRKYMKIGVDNHDMIRKYKEVKSKYNV